MNVLYNLYNNVSNWYYGTEKEKSLGEKESPLNIMINERPEEVVLIEENRPNEKPEISKLTIDALSTFITEKQSETDIAITTIQKFVRSYLASIAYKEEQRHSLNISLSQQVVQTYLTTRGFSSLPRVEGAGKTKVYLPKEFPVVIKHSGSSQSKERFEKMNQFREICEKESYQYLIIPKARIHGEFIIEERLPIRVNPRFKYDPKEQIGLYIENREQFTDAIKEFTHFCCKNHIHDLTFTHSTISKNLYSLFDIPLRGGRYDNVPLYKTEENGQVKYQIGLIDLEGFYPLDYPKTEEAIIESLKEVITLFPYHFEAILAIGTKYCANIETSYEELKQRKEESLLVLKKLYEDHLAFLKNNEILLHDSCQLIIKPHRVDQLIEKVGQAIQEKHEGAKVDNEEEKRYYKTAAFPNFLGDQAEIALSAFKQKEMFLIIDKVRDFISQELKAKNHGQQSVASYNELICLRSLELCIFGELKEEVKSHLNAFSLIERKKNLLATLILDTLFTEMEGNELLVYRSFNCSDDNEQLICC
jgi:hypothetical protein